MSKKKKYVQVGVGGRSWMYVEAMCKTYKDSVELAAICDINPGRMEYTNRKIADLGCEPVKAYMADQFEQMVAEQKPDIVIVTTGPDVTHSDYICRAMELGCDVVTEKPMTTDETRCVRILETCKKTGRNVQVAFNYRYAPPRSQVRELIMDGVIGEVLSVEMGWYLDTRHGADYFRRWHRDRDNSGSLLVHKSTHHFDLVSWWIDDIPQDVFCQASRQFYAPETAKRFGLEARGERCTDCPCADKCKFYLDMTEGELKELYLDCENYDGYFRDRCIFGEGVSIWDTMSVTTRYSKGAILNYILHTYAPYEGFRVAFNGTKGRLEHFSCEDTYVNGDGTVPGELSKDNVSITLIPEFSKAQEVEVKMSEGGHGGADPILLDDIFSPNAPVDPLKRKAFQKDGTYSVMTGIAAYHSIDTGTQISIPDLLGDAPIG